MAYFGLIDTLRTALETESQSCTTVTEGDLYDVDLSKQTLFPLVHLVVNNARFTSNTIVFNVSIIAMDIIDLNKNATTDKFRGNDNEQDILEKMLLLLNRIYKLLQSGTLNDAGFDIENEPDCEPFRERHENNLAGWTMTLDIIAPNTMTSC